MSRPAEALPYFERLVKEFEQSEYLEKAHKRIAELKAATPAKAKEVKVKRTRMLPVLVALSVPALTAAQTPTPPTRTRPQMENAADSRDMLQQPARPRRC